jgi:hypothetical protein
LSGRPPFPYLTAGKRVLELGAGGGTVGLALARLGAHVTLTDLPAMVAVLEVNAEMNFPKGLLQEGSSAACDLGHGTVSCHAQKWGEPLIGGPYDLGALPKTLSASASLLVVACLMGAGPTEGFFVLSSDWGGHRLHGRQLRPASMHDGAGGGGRRGGGVCLCAAARRRAFVLG